MSNTQASTDSHPSVSDFDDQWAEALIIAVCEGDNTPDTPHSHDLDSCHGGNAHGQGAPVYSCGCYRRTKVEPALKDVSEQDEGLEGDVDSCNAQAGGRSGEIWPLKRKRDSIGDMTPHHFGQNLTNARRAETVPALEMPKCRKLGNAFEFNGSTTRARETLVLDVAKQLEAAIDRQTEVLAKICRVLESRAE